MHRPRVYLLAVAVSLMAGAPLRGAEAVHRVFLEINGTYVVHTHPLPPLVDRRGHVMVPLRVTGRLMGLEVTLKRDGRLGEVTSKGSPAPRRPLLLEAGNRTARIGAEAFSLPVAPQWLASDSDLLVPIRALVGSFAIRPTWQGRHRVLSLRGGGLLEADDLDQLQQMIDFVGYTAYRHFTPVALSSRSVRVFDRVPGEEITLVLERTGGDRTDGTPVLFGLARFANGENEIITPLVVTAERREEPDPCTRQGGRMRCVLVFQRLAYRGPMEYLVIRVHIKP